jgi:hypothetical protein
LCHFTNYSAFPKNRKKHEILIGKTLYEFGPKHWKTPAQNAENGPIQLAPLKEGNEGLGRLFLCPPRPNRAQITVSHPSMIDGGERFSA